MIDKHDVAIHFTYLRVKDPATVRRYGQAHSEVLLNFKDATDPLGCVSKCGGCRWRNCWTSRCDMRWGMGFAARWLRRKLIERPLCFGKGSGFPAREPWQH